MNRLVRLLWLLLRSRWAGACSPLGPCVTSLRVWPNDLDVLLHVNNGIYLSLCDLARVDLMLRSDSLGVVTGRRRIFLVAAETIQFHRSLRLFERFAIETRVLGWDDKGFFVHHRFSARPAAGERPDTEGTEAEKTVAIAVVEGRVMDQRSGLISPADVLAQLGIAPESPPLPQWVRQWRDDQRELRRTTRGEEENAVAPPDPARRSGAAG